MVTAMRRMRGAVAGLVTVAVLVAGCDSGTPSAAPPTSSAPTSAPPPLTSPPPATSPAVPTYTPPPSRGVTRPPGLGHISSNICAFASISAQGFIGAWSSGLVAYVQDGEKVPDFQWQDAARVLPSRSFSDGVKNARTGFQQAGVPANHPVFSDLSELEAAMREGIAVAKAKDETKVMAVYFRLRTADDHLTESCGALED